jgi:uncharacterized membrane protein
MGTSLNIRREVRAMVMGMEVDMGTSISMGMDMITAMDTAVTTLLMWRQITSKSLPDPLQITSREDKMMEGETSMMKTMEITMVTIMLWRQNRRRC